MSSWNLIKEKKVYDGYRKVLRRTFNMPDKTTIDFDVIKSDGAVATLALTDDQKIVCFRTFRPGPMGTLYEIPGGGVDNKDALQKEAERELLEETGYAANMEYIGSYWLDAYTTGKRHMYIGRHAKKIADSDQNAEEFGEVVLLSIDEFKKQLFSGNMSDTTLGYAGLHKLGLL